MSKIKSTDEQPKLIESCEDPNVIYLCYRGIRFIFRNGEYDGWYHANDDPVNKPDKKNNSSIENILIGRINRMRKDGMTAKEIAEKTKQPLSKVKEIIQICKDADKRRKDIQSEHKNGVSTKDIAAKFGISESTVRRIIKED